MNQLPTDVQEFDFRKPCAVASEVEHRLREWQDSICRFIFGRWQPYFSTSISWTVQPLTTNRPTRMKFEREVVAFTVLVTEQGTTTLLVIPRNLAQGLVHLMLGLEVNKLPDDRPLTALEESALELAFRAFVDAALETRPKTPKCDLGIFHPNPDVQRVFRDVRDLVIGRFRLEGPFGAENIDWIWPETVISDLFRTPTDAQQSAATAQLLHEIAQELPFELILRLGTTHLRLSELSRLAEGDLVILDQRVSEPLRAYIGGTPFFLGWPGRMGNRQGMQVEQLIPLAMPAAV